MNPLRRKLILATWSAPKEGNIHGKMSLDCTTVLSYLDYLKEKHGRKITITHFIGRALGEGLHRTPSLNGYIRLGKYIPHDSVAVSFLVAIKGGNLGNVKVDNIEQKTLLDVASALRSDASSLRDGKDKDFEAAQRTLRLMPPFLIRPMLWLTGWLTSSLGFNMSFLGLPKFPFGACMITSVGMFNLDEGYAPHTPFARVPVLAVIGASQKRAIVMEEDGVDQIVIRPMITLTATVDHRYIDGMQGASFAETVREAFQKPWILDGLTEAPEDWTC